MVYPARAYPGFLSMKWVLLGVLLHVLPLDGMPVHFKVTPLLQHLIRLPWQRAGTHSDSWVERDTVRAKCFPKNAHFLEPWPVVPKSSAMINTPPCFSQWWWWDGKWWQHQYQCLDINLSHTLHGWGSTPYISRALTLSRKFFSATAGTWPLWDKKFLTSDQLRVK